MPNSTENAIRVRARAAELVERYGARLGMDEYAAAQLVKVILSIPIDDGGASRA